MTTPTENTPTEKTAPTLQHVAVTVAPGRTLMSSENKGDATKVHKAGTQVELEETEAQRLAALGFVVLPGSETETPPADAQSRASKGRFTISPKDGPRVEK